MLKQITNRYLNKIYVDSKHRFKSWDHCNVFFGNFISSSNKEQEENFELACLHLAFYLASWGMLRGTSFLLWKDFTVHEEFIKQVVLDTKYICLFGRTDFDGKYFECVDELIVKTREVYHDGIKIVDGVTSEINISDTLVSKILLGIYGCVPAFDSYVKCGLKKIGLSNPSLDRKTLLFTSKFYQDNFTEFHSLDEDIKRKNLNYPPMKLIDMFFWEAGSMYIDSNKLNQDDLKIYSLLKEFMANYERKYKIKKSDKAGSKLQKAGLTDRIRQYVIDTLDKARKNGKDELVLVSGLVHNEMGLKNRMPAVCNAMTSIPSVKYKVIHDTPSGKSSTKKIIYFLK